MYILLCVLNCSGTEEASTCAKHVHYAANCGLLALTRLQRGSDINLFISTFHINLLHLSSLSLVTSLLKIHKENHHQISFKRELKTSL